MDELYILLLAAAYGSHGFLVKRVPQSQFTSMSHCWIPCPIHKIHISDINQPLFEPQVYWSYISNSIETNQHFALKY